MKTALVSFTLLSVLTLSALGATACTSRTDGRLENYTGDINGMYKISMTLVFGADAVNGEYFYHAHMKDIALKGSIASGDVIALDEHDAAGKVVARFNGSMLGDCSTIKGDWQKAGAADKLPFSLKLTGSHSGRITRRYATAGAEDDELVHANARTFWLGVKHGDKKAVASMMAYPARAQIAGKKRQFHNAKEFIASYDAIFTPGYRQAVLNSVPHNMSSSWRGIMLGEAGEVWLNDVGKVKALNNP